MRKGLILFILVLVAAYFLLPDLEFTSNEVSPILIPTPPVATATITQTITIGNTMPTTPQPIDSIYPVMTEACDPYGSWLPMALFICGFIFMLYLTKLYFEMRKLDKEHAHRLELAQIPVVDPEPIMLPATPEFQFSHEHVVSPDDVSIDTSLIVDFIANYRDVGLNITKWRTRPGWTQNTIAAVLDWLAHYGYVTPRRAGVACTWTDEYSVRQLTELFGITLHRG